MLDGVTMVLKLGFILLFAGLVGILEVQAASVAIKNDMWNSLRQADQDKRNIEGDSLETENLPTDEDFGYEDIDSDAAEDAGHYSYALLRRAVCGDAFKGLCQMVRKNNQCSKGRNMRFARKFCRSSCPEYCI